MQDNTHTAFLPVAPMPLRGFHIENSCGNVKWKKRMPVSDKGKGRGIGLLNVKQSIDKYDGDLQLKQDGNRFVADLFLNS